MCRNKKYCKKYFEEQLKISFLEMVFLLQRFMSQKQVLKSSANHSYCSIQETEQDGEVKQELMKVRKC